MRKLFCFLIVIVILLSVSIFTFGTTPTEEKKYCTATLEDDFAEDSVLVMMTNKASLELKMHTPADFPEVRCIAVNDLSSYTRKVAQVKLSGGHASELGLDDLSRAQSVLNDFNPKTFHLTYCLVLKKPGKENVLKAIEALQKRDDIYCAEPSYLLSLSSGAPDSTSADDTAETPFPLGATVGISILLCFLIARALFFRIRKDHTK